MDKKKPDPPSGLSESPEPFDESVHDNWPNSFSTREELDAMLEAGLKSGVSERDPDEFFKSLLSDLKDV